jgi:hypothetical protein
MNETDIYNVSNDSIATYNFKEKITNKQAINRPINIEIVQQIYNGVSLIHLNKNQELIWLEKAN